jgi:hypothetical protein
MPVPGPRRVPTQYYADLFRAPLHEVLPKPSPPLHLLESGGMRVNTLVFDKLPGVTVTVTVKLWYLINYPA